MALSGIGEFIIFGFMPLMIGMLAGRTRPAPTVSAIAGRLVLPPCDPLPDGALVTVELIEQRRGESVQPARASQTLPWQGGGIQDFALRLEGTCLDPLAFYALRARIEVDGVTVLETAHPQRTAPLSGGRSTLLLVPAA